VVERFPSNPPVPGRKGGKKEGISRASPCGTEQVLQKSVFMKCASVSVSKRWWCPWGCMYVIYFLGFVGVEAKHSEVICFPKVGFGPSLCTVLLGDWAPKTFQTCFLTWKMEVIAPSLRQLGGKSTMGLEQPGSQAQLLQCQTQHFDNCMQSFQIGKDVAVHIW
jgi:hypothetical protein